MLHPEIVMNVTTIYVIELGPDKTGDSIIGMDKE